MKTKSIPFLLSLAVLASCADKKGSSSDSDSAAVNDVKVENIVLDGQWNIDTVSESDSLSVRPATETPGTEQFIKFENDSFFIQTNCNTISGTYTLQGDSISFGAGAATEMACDNMATEDMLRKVLPAIATVEVENDSTMRLVGGNPSEYILIRKAAADRKGAKGLGESYKYVCD